MTADNGKGIDTAYHYTPADGWTPGDLDFFTVPQKTFTAEEHETWRILYKRQMEVLPGRAVDTFMDSLSTLGISQDRIPSIDEVNAILQARTGWTVVTVPGLIPDQPFFELLAARRFPTGNFIRSREQLDYIQEPDIFHDLFGHVPMLADPVFADYVQSFGEGGLRAAKLGVTEKIARLYWYTVEFGLIQQPEGLRIYGAGILSSPTETLFALEDASPHRIKFDVPRILQTHFHIDDFQDNYFVIDSFQNLFDETQVDFGPIYADLDNKPEYFAGTLLESDGILQRGTGAYALEAAQRRDVRRNQKG